VPWRRIRYALALIALCAIATCPTAKRACVAHQRAREAEDLLGALADRVAEIAVATGKVPPLSAGPTPRPACCEVGGTCDPDPKLWDAPGWRALAFSIDGPFRYSYEYAPDASGTSAVLRAVGDLDCDGTTSLYEIRLTVDGTKIERTSTRKDPFE
jgi:hypothetical protein